MVRIPLIGVPKHAWKKFTSLFDASAALIVWRIALLIGVTWLTVFAWVATGGGGLAALILGFAITSILSYALRDDVVAVWADLWNARWGEVEV